MMLFLWGAFTLSLYSRQLLICISWPLMSSRRDIIYHDIDDDVLRAWKSCCILCCIPESKNAFISINSCYAICCFATGDLIKSIVVACKHFFLRRGYPLILTTA